MSPFSYNIKPMMLAIEKMDLQEEAQCLYYKKQLLQISLCSFLVPVWNHPGWG